MAAGVGIFDGDLLDALERHWSARCEDPTVLAQLECERALELEREVESSPGERGLCREAWAAWLRALELEPRLTTARAALLRYVTSDLLSSEERGALYQRLDPLGSSSERIALRVRAAQCDDAEQADRRLREALEIAPDNREVHAALARLARRATDDGAAASCFLGLAESTSDPRLAGACRLQAAWRLEMALDDPTRAERIARQGLADQPDDPSLAAVVSRTALANGQARAAAQALVHEAEIAAAPELASARLVEAARILARRLGSFERAAQLVERAVELCATPLALRLAREIAMEHDADPDRVEILCRRLAEVAPDDATRARFLWLATEEMGEGPRASALLEEAVAADAGYLTAALALELAWYRPDAVHERVEALARRGRAEHLPGLLVQAGRIALDSLDDAARAESLFREALTEVRTTDALAGPLGAAEALGELLADRARHADEVELLGWLLEQPLEPPRRKVAQARRADLLTRLGRGDEAIDAWYALLELDPGDDHALCRLVALLESRGDDEAALEVRQRQLTRLEVTDRERAEIVRWICAERLARRLDRVDDALSLLDQGIEHAPSMKPLLVSSARLLIEHGRDHALATLYRRELIGRERTDPDAARAALNLAMHQEFELGDARRALGAYRRVLEGHPDEIAALLGVVRLADAVSEDPSLATDALRRLADTVHDDTDLRAALYFELGDRLLERHDDVAAACEAYASSLEADPRSAIANIAWEACAVRLGHFEAVNARLVQLIETSERDDDDAVEWLERALFLTTDDPEARGVLETILRRDPRNLGALLRWMLLAMGGSHPAALATSAHGLATALPPGTLQAALMELAVVCANHGDVGLDIPSLLWHIVEVRHDDPVALVRLLASMSRVGLERRERIKIHGALARGAQTPAERAGWLTSLGRLLADDGQYERAELALEQVLKDHPGHLSAIRLLRVLAEDVGERGRLAEAVELEARAMDDPKRAVAHLLRAAEVRRRQMGDVDGAAQVLEEVLRIDPAHDEAFAELQDLYTSQSNLERLYELLCRRAESEAAVEARRRLLLRAAELAYDRMRDMERAIAAHRRILAREPDFLRSYRVIAEIHLENQDWGRAADALRGVLELARDDRLLGRTWLKLAEVYDAHLGETDLAIAALRRACEYLPDNTDALHRLAEIFERLGRYKETVICLEAIAAIERVPLERKEVLLRLCDLHLERFDDADAARDTLVIAREIDPSDLSLTQRLADAYARRGWRDQRLAFLTSSFDEYRDRFAANVSRPSPLHALFEIAGLLEDRDRQFTIASVLSFVGSASEAQTAFYQEHQSSTRQRLPQRQLPMQKTQGIFAPGLHVNILHVLRASDPVIARFAPLSLRALGVRRSHRASAGSRPDLAALQPFAGAYGIELPDLYLVPDRGDSLHFVPGDEPAFVLDPRDLEPALLPETMARVAVGSASLAMGLANYASMDAVTFECVVLGVCKAVLPERRFGLPAQQEVIETVARSIPRRVTESLAGYVLEVSDQLDRETLHKQHHAVIATSMRLGLLTMFDPRPGLTVVARDGDAGRFDVVSIMKDALLFLVGDRYAALRREVGIALD